MPLETTLPGGEAACQAPALDAPTERECSWCGQVYAPETAWGDQCAACDALDWEVIGWLDTGAALEAARIEAIEDARFLALHRAYGPQWFDTL